MFVPIHIKMLGKQVVDNLEKGATIPSSLQYSITNRYQKLFFTFSKTLW